MLALSYIKDQLRDGKYAFPGGYPKFFLCADGETLSFEAVRENFRQIAHAHTYPAYRDATWTLVGCDINWEDSTMVCAHTNKPIESAYGDDVKVED